MVSEGKDGLMRKCSDEEFSPQTPGQHVPLGQVAPIPWAPPASLLQVSQPPGSVVMPGCPEYTHLDHGCKVHSGENAVTSVPTDGCLLLCRTHTPPPHTPHPHTHTTPPHTPAVLTPVLDQDAELLGKPESGGRDNSPSRGRNHEPENKAADAATVVAGLGAWLLSSLALYQG